MDTPFPSPPNTSRFSRQQVFICVYIAAMAAAVGVSLWLYGVFAAHALEWAPRHLELQAEAFAVQGLCAVILLVVIGVVFTRFRSLPGRWLWMAGFFTLPATVLLLGARYLSTIAPCPLCG